MWPDSLVHVFPQALPEEVMAMAAKDADALSHCDNFWVSKERILAGPSACTTPAELAVCLLYQQHVGRHLPETWQGAEYWVQVYQPGRGLGFHFDKDEHLLKSTGQMRNPIWSSVLYLTGRAGPTECNNNYVSRFTSDGTDSSSCIQYQFDGSSYVNGSYYAGDDWDGARQAPTVILQQMFDDEQGAVPVSPSRSVLVWPLRGNYCLFDGRLGHGVLDSCSNSRRATLLVNWWAQQPQAVHDLDDSATEALNLTRLSDTQIQQALKAGPQPGQAHCSSCGSKHTSCAAHGGDVDAVATALAAVTCSTGTIDGIPCHSDTNLNEPKAAMTSSKFVNIAAVSCQSTNVEDVIATGAQAGTRRSSKQHSSRSCLPCCHVTAASDVQMVDAVLAANKLTLAGPDAVSAVAFEHPGFILYPIEPEEAEAAAEQLPRGALAAADSNRKKLQTLAAFVSEQMMADCSKDDDS